MQGRRTPSNWPFTWMLLVGLLLDVLVDWTGVLYDSSGAWSLVYCVALLLAFPVWIAHEILSSFELLHSLYISKWVAAGLGLAIAIGLDIALAKFRQQLRH